MRRTINHPNSCIKITQTTFVEGYWSMKNEPDYMLIIYKGESFGCSDITWFEPNEYERSRVCPFPVISDKKYRHELDIFVEKLKNGRQSRPHL